MSNLQPAVFVLESEVEDREVFQRTAEAAGFEVIVCESPQALAKLCADPVSAIVVLSLSDDRDNRLALLESGGLEEADEIFLTGGADNAGLREEWLAHGVSTFIRKPLDRTFIEDLFQDAFSALAARRSAGDAPSRAPLDQFGLLLGSSPPMKKLFRLLRKLTTVDTSVLISGESGTGKELVARTLHMLGHRAAGPFVALNCGAIPSELIESELFGHEKGSFSGADEQHIGVFERAGGGTLFLDELTEMPLELQVKLLRVLETGTLTRVGGEEDIACDVRVVAAANQEPQVALEEGKLREDLYYRVAEFGVRLASLREKRDDLTGLAFHFLNELNEASGTDVGLSDAALASLHDHTWPGNVRELRSVIQRAYIVANECIEVDDLPALDNDVLDDGDYLRVSVGTSLDQSEKRLIMATLKATGDDKKRTAEVLGISLKTLYNRLNEYKAQGADDGTHQDE